MKTPIARLTRDGQVRDAYTRGEVTSLRNAGWSPVAEYVGEQGAEPQTYPDGVRVLAADETAAAVDETPKPETKRSHRKRKDTK